MINDYTVVATHRVLKSHRIKMGVMYAVFFHQGFLSQAPTIHSAAGEGRGPSFIPLHHFHPLMNIQRFICNFACEVTITYFQPQRLCLPDCYPMRFNHLIELPFDWLIDDAMFVCLLHELILGFCYSGFWHWKALNLNSHRLSHLY